MVTWRTGKVVDTEWGGHLRLRQSLGGGDETPTNKPLARGQPHPSSVRGSHWRWPTQLEHKPGKPPTHTCPWSCLARASAGPSTHGGSGQWMAGAAHPMWKPQEAWAGALLGYPRVSSRQTCQLLLTTRDMLPGASQPLKRTGLSSFGLNMVTQCPLSWLLSLSFPSDSLLGRGA